MMRQCYLTKVKFLYFFTTDPEVKRKEGIFGNPLLSEMLVAGSENTSIIAQFPQALQADINRINRL